MEFEDVKQKINSIIYEVVEGRISMEEITPEKHLVDDLGIESSEILEIFLSIMSDYDIEIDRKSVMNFKNLNDIYNYTFSSCSKK